MLKDDQSCQEDDPSSLEEDQSFLEEDQPYLMEHHTYLDVALQPFLEDVHTTLTSLQEHQPFQVVLPLSEVHEPY